MRRVAITGAGTVNALGPSVGATWAAMREGRCAIAPLDLRDAARLSAKIGAQVTGWQAEALFDHQKLQLCDRFTLFTLAAARQAVAQSGLDLAGPAGEAGGVIFGTAAGGLGTSDDGYRAVYEEGRARVHP
ncbi:MAG: beta-ACP synthase, partial [Gemmobacter sp.]|nr:beta-ACP synthase [Gemmobacter sp.]